MGSITNFLENALLGHLVTASFTPAATIYVALCAADPGEAAIGATMNEITNTAQGYARQPVTFDAAASRKVVQSGAVSFPQATGAWAQVSHWALVSSVSGAGDVYAYGNFVTPFTPVTGNTPTIPTGELEVEIQATGAAGGFTDYLVHNWLNRAFRNQAFAKPATYIGLTLDVIGDTDVAFGNITEVSTAGTAYARVLVNATGGASPAWTAVANGAADNLHVIQFPIPTASWGQVVSMMIIDSGPAGGTAGNILAYDSVSIVDQTPVANDTVQFAIGSLDLAIS